VKWLLDTADVEEGVVVAEALVVAEAGRVVAAVQPV